jgi:glutamate dehydrogenase (NADP+)
MSQNAEHTIFTEDDVFEKLEAIMVNIFKQSVAACEKYNLGDDLIAGANIAGFERVANAMLMQGIV